MLNGRLRPDAASLHPGHGGNPAARPVHDRDDVGVGCRLAALEKLSIERGLITSAELDARTAEYATGQRDDD